MTLGAAMFTRRGGNPLGPAGTGKTETVKDFGKVGLWGESWREGGERREGAEGVKERFGG